jgi:hypothetical protein
MALQELQALQANKTGHFLRNAPRTAVLQQA